MDAENTTMAVQDNDIDAEWGDDEGVTATDPVETAPETPAAETPAENQQQEPSTETQDQADQPKMYTLKNRDETRQVSETDLIAMAQKGWDYDTVRTERDQLRQYRSEADPALSLVKGYAARMGMSVPLYLDYCRQQELMSQGMTEQAAKTHIGMEKKDAELTARENALKAQEAAQTSAAARAQEAAANRQKDIQAFYKAYPGVDPKTIPQEVWAAVSKGETLTVAYTMYENRRLQAELAAEKQNKTNQASAPGSLGGNSVTEQDEIDRMWAEDDE